ncbi:MAG: flagellar biosynthesis protein FliQ [candidate division Zixibacteria bacterium]|nr:flagellar biosynthesis protein FliQ [candidate division Zixibacteria bacterium]MBU1471574.1 flagellar biosynthesis protein FliQ [candidate division Zixibacteria bacterium]MBU2624828.1 flagellar biosynthesis protein FliQ [candidate division Zixibacteria bacterium]
MTVDFVLGLGREAIMLTLLVAGPMLAFGLIIGLIISIFQAVTQIHEMTLTFIPKIVAVAFALILFLPWMISIVTDFTTRLFESIPGLVG